MLQSVLIAGARCWISKPAIMERVRSWVWVMATPVVRSPGSDPASKLKPKWDVHMLEGQWR